MSGIISSVTDALLTSMGTDLFSKSANLISGLAPLFSAGFGLYLLLVIVTYYSRGFDEAFVDLAKRCLGWMIIISFAFNAGMYQKLANMAYELPEALGSLVASGKFEFSALDATMDQFIEKIGLVFEIASRLDWDDVGGKIGVYVTGLAMAVVGSLFLIILVAFYLVAKLSLAMVILVGPIFIGAMLFPATRQWGMNWIGQILNYSITITFYVILALIQYAYFESQLLTEMDKFRDIVQFNPVIPVLIQFLLSTIIFIVVAFNVPSIASALTGGASAGGFGAVANAARQAAMLAKGIGFGARMPKSGGSISKG